MYRRVVVTGGSGFIGSNIIEYLRLSGGFSILNIDLLTPPDKGHTNYWEKLNILDLIELKSAIKLFQPDCVIHLAARTDLDGKTVEEYSVNTVGTLNLISVCKEVSSIKKVLFASSMLVCKAGHIPSSDSDYSAETPYGLSKIEMEKLIRMEGLSCEWSIVRPTSIWGPGFKSPYRDFFETVKRGHFFDIGGKYCVKTYGYIGNTVYQIMSILESSSSDKKIYYLGDAPPICISDWAREIALEFHQPLPKRIPFGLVKLAAIFGDLLSSINIRFPMSSFRLKNMTTNNIYNLNELYLIAPEPPYSRLEGIRFTVEWLNNQERNK